MKLLNFTIPKLTLFLVIGIVIAHYSNFKFHYVLVFTIALLLGIGMYWFVLKTKINRTPYFSWLSYLCVVGIGMIAYGIQNESLQDNHYTNLTQNDTQTIQFQILERLKPDKYNDKYIAKVLTFNNKTACGKILINIKKDSLTKPFVVDDKLFTSTALKTIQKPLNPFQFNYNNYLKLKQVYRQAYLNNDKILRISNSKNSISGLADQLRTTINTKLVEAGFKNDVLGIINALILGQRQDISKATYNNYVNSGTIHILAVSGLHVGILLIILNFLLKPLLYLKHGNGIKLFLIVLLLWTFAIVAGLSPSVTRAVTMFTAISIAMHLKRSTNIYNTLAISAFFILLFKPIFLFEVGFQMSYLAVIGIVSIQPIFYKYWQPKYWIPNKLWQIFTVTLAAQVGVLPISLFYFHQFPGLFFISNIVIIPFLGLILGFGILVITLALINQLPNIFVSAYSVIIEGLNNFIAWIAQLEDFLFKDIPFTILQVICAYAIIVTLVQAYRFKTFKWIAISLIGIICFQGVTFYNSYTNQHDAFVIFNKSRFSIIGLKHNTELLVHHNFDSLKLKSDNTIKNYKVGKHISRIKTDSLKTVYLFKGKTILVMDSIITYKGLSFKPDYLFLRNSPKLNLNRIIDSLKPELIIADASNFKSYTKRWKATCINKKIPFHYTNEKGAFILD